MMQPLNVTLKWCRLFSLINNAIPISEGRMCIDLGQDRILATNVRLSNIPVRQKRTREKRRMNARDNRQQQYTAAVH